MKGEFQRLLEISQEMAGKTKATCMTRPMARLAYRTLWFAKLGYVLPFTSFTIDECIKLAAPFLAKCLPAMGYNRHMPRVVLYGPMKYGGQALLALFTEQGIDGLQALIGHIRAETDISHLLLILLSYLQVIAGIQAPYLQSCHLRLPHVPKSWLSHLRNFLASFNGSLTIADAWTPTPARAQDVCLMDSLLQYEGTRTPTSAEITQFNACRIYVKAMYLSCLTSLPAGLLILTAMYHPIIMSME